MYKLESMEAKLQKWGNSLGIRIPMNLLKDLSLRKGSVVSIEKKDDELIIRPKKEEANMDITVELEVVANTTMYKNLKKKIGIKSDRELFNLALNLLNVSVEEKERGAKIGSFQEKEGAYQMKEFGFADLDRVKVIN